MPASSPGTPANRPAGAATRTVWTLNSRSKARINTAARYYLSESPSPCDERLPHRHRRHLRRCEARAAWGRVLVGQSLGGRQAASPASWRRVLAMAAVWAITMSAPGPNERRCAANSRRQRSDHHSLPGRPISSRRAWKSGFPCMALNAGSMPMPISGASWRFRLMRSHDSASSVRPAMA